MKRPRAVSPAARAVFLEVLLRKTPHAAALPNPLRLNYALGVFDKAGKHTDQLRVLAGHDAKGFFLDYYRVYNDGENSWHGRIHEDARTEALENIEGEVGTRWFPDPADTERERRRVGAHNDRVRELLKKKGFL